MAANTSNNNSSTIMGNHSLCDSFEVVPSPIAGDVSEEIVAPLFSSLSESPAGTVVNENDGVDNGNKKPPVWNKLSSEAPGDFGPVMGAQSWPALSEAARGSMKASGETLKVLFTGSSSSNSQGIGIVPSPPLGPVDQKSLRPNGVSVSASSVDLQPLESLSQSVDMPPNNRPPWSNAQSTGFMSQSNNGNHNLQQRNLGRGRGSNPNHQSQGGRFNQVRGNAPPNFNGNVQSHRSPRYVRPPQPLSPYTGARVYPIASSIGFRAQSLDSLRGMPYDPAVPPHLPYFAAQDFPLYGRIVKQIDYYFSDANLVSDVYLRRKMDEQGWVPINLVAGFPRTKQLTEDIQVILNALRFSTAVEVQGHKLRKRNDWKKWIISHDVRFPNVSNLQHRFATTSDRSTSA